MRKNFIDYLKEIHMQENPELLDDDLPDDFDRWLCTIEQDVLIQHAEDLIEKIQDAHQNELYDLAEMEDLNTI